ncbi:hypothetical protein M271_39095 [Streptomyces rapamycinicus NRRL 5491]|nr:hypothetical protein M271_39095 [Streptomyces rapamycinicus NRRL 5491]
MTVVASTSGARRKSAGDGAGEYSSMSIGPSRSSAAVSAACRAGRSVTSAGNASARTPVSDNSSATACSVVRLRAISATSTPSAADRRPIARPS